MQLKNACLAEKVGADKDLTGALNAKLIIIQTILLIQIKPV